MYDHVQPVSGDEKIDLLLRGACRQNGLMLVITDREGRIRYANEGFTRLTGYQLEEVVGVNPRLLQSGLTPIETYRDLWRTITSGSIWSGQLLNRKKSGELYWASLTVAPIKDEAGAITHFVGMEDDITAMKQLEAELREANNRLEEANVELKHYASMVSHDLRAPLATTATALRIFLGHQTGSLSTEAIEILSIMERSLRSMDRLIDRLLRYAKLGAKQLEYDTFDAFMAADLARDDLSALIRERRAKVSIEKLPVVTADRILLQEVFQNLIENAIKYNRSANPEVWVSGLKSRTEAIFTVMDNGEGFDPQKAKLIFEPFERLSGSSSGTGLGLASCKKAVLAHGGEIWAETERGKGSAFHFTIPLGHTDE